MNWGSSFGGLYNKDHSGLRSVLGSSIFGNFQIRQAGGCGPRIRYDGIGPASVLLLRGSPGQVGELGSVWICSRSARDSATCFMKNSREGGCYSYSCSYSDYYSL